MMGRPDGDLKTYQEFLDEVGDEEEAAYLACNQLEGKTINTQLGAGHDNFIVAVLERVVLQWMM
ncbi:MAG: hypothetical protein U5N58_08385 [Actinomycetota bacterium]|nr:hypothetical protein [Actinomycetota bacterium]